MRAFVICFTMSSALINLVPNLLRSRNRERQQVSLRHL